MTLSEVQLGMDMDLMDLIGLKCLINLDPDSDSWTIDEKNDPKWVITGIICTICHKNYDLSIRLRAELIEGDVDHEDVMDVMADGVADEQIVFLRDQFKYKH